MDGEAQSYVEPIKFLSKGAKSFFFFLQSPCLEQSFFFLMQVAWLVRKKSDYVALKQ